MQTKDASDAAEAEKALRGLLPRHAPACLRLVGLLELSGKNDEALAVAQNGVKSFPKDPVAELALGTAWWGKKENAKAEAAFQEAVRLSPDGTAPALALLEFYAGTGQEKLAREKLEEMLRKTKLSELDRELLRADGLARLGDRKDAKDAYRQGGRGSQRRSGGADAAGGIPAGQQDAADEAEAEKVLRGIARQYDPARRRLAEVLIAHGGEEEWEEAQKLLELSAGDPTPAWTASPRRDRWSAAGAWRTWPRRRRFART